MNFLQILISCLVLLILDITWVLLFMRHQYKALVPRIQGSEMKVNVFYVVAAYSFMLVGLIWCVVRHIKKDNILTRLKNSFLNGFIYGVVLYGVYNCTAGSVFKDWSIKLTIIDCLWGGFVYSISAFIGSLALDIKNKNE